MLISSSVCEWSHSNWKRSRDVTKKWQRSLQLHRSLPFLPFFRSTWHGRLQEVHSSHYRLFWFPGPKTERDGNHQVTISCDLHVKPPLHQNNTEDFILTQLFHFTNNQNFSVSRLLHIGISNVEFSQFGTKRKQLITEWFIPVSTEFFSSFGSLTYFHNFTTSAYQPHFSGLCIAPHWGKFGRIWRDGCGSGRFLHDIVSTLAFDWLISGAWEKTATMTCDWGETNLWHSLTHSLTQLHSLILPHSSLSLTLSHKHKTHPQRPDVLEGMYW